MTRAFITGIGGQDGSYLAEQLLSDGMEVHALVRSADGAPAYCPSDVVLHPGDLTDVDDVRRLVLDLRPAQIYNLAAISSVAESWADPDSCSLVNGHAAVALLETARQVSDDARLVQASSAEIFGQPEQSPQDETTPVRPVSPYGAAKAYAHHAVGVARQRGQHASSLILYNHESPRRPRQFVTRKITSTVARIARGEADELVLGNLDSRRDWGWAPDYVDAMVRAARADDPGDYVIATGASHSVRDFVGAAFAAAGITDWEPLVRSDPAFFRPVDPVTQVGDSGLAGRRLGWAPTVPFAEVVGRMVATDLGRDPG